MSEQEKMDNLGIPCIETTPDEKLTSTRPIRAVANTMRLTVNELILAAGTIKIIRNQHVDASPTTGANEAAATQNREDPEVIFDELCQDEFAMRYAD